MEFKSCIFTYDKQDDLVQFVGLEDDGSIDCFYKIDGMTLSKTYTNRFSDGHTEHRRTVIEFEEPCQLKHRFLDGESSVVAVKKNSMSYEFPKIKDRVDVNGEDIENFKTEKSMLEQWASMSMSSTSGTASF